MSLVRLGVARRIIASAKTMTYMANHVAPFARWQSTATPASGLITLRALVYGMSTAGLMIGGSLVYANHNPLFRSKADEYVPGFARLADFAADKWATVKDTVKPTAVDRTGLNKDLGSKLDSKLSNHKNDSSEVKPSVMDEIPEAKESCSIETSDKDVSVLCQATEATTDEAGVPSPSLSTEEFIDTTTTGVADGDSVQQSCQHMKEKEDKKFQKIAAESQSEVPTEVAVACIESSTPTISVEPNASVEGSVASVKEVHATSKGAIEIQSQDLWSALSSEEHFKWLQDAAQAELLLQEVYDKFRRLDKKTYDIRSVLIQAEKHRQDKYGQAMRINTDDKALMHTIARDIAKADEAVLTAKKNITLSQFDTYKVGQELACLLDKASDLGLKPKVEEIRQELSQLHAHAMLGVVDYTETVSSIVKEHQYEMEKVKEWISSELGTVLPQADSQQKTILTLTKRVDMLLQKLEEAENNHQGHISNALLRQKDELEQLAEKKLQLHLQVQEQEMWREAREKLNKAICEKEEELKDQLLMQATAHNQHLSDALQAQAEQLGAKWANQTEAKLTQQGTRYQNDMMKAMAGLLGVKAMVDTIASAGERTRQQQSLWTVCDTLIGALEQADVITDPNGCYSFVKEIVSLREVAHGDYFILAVLGSIPQEAVDNKYGIHSEAGLRQRFKKVKQVCKQVALIPETGGGLGTYALSYLHSMFTFDLWHHVNSKKNPVDMDTFELIQTADALLKQGNMEGAVRLINYLQGEPRRVAQDWLRDAQLYLETKQAISLVQNYMASISLSIIH